MLKYYVVYLKLRCNWTSCIFYGNPASLSRLLSLSLTGLSTFSSLPRVGVQEEHLAAAVCAVPQLWTVVKEQEFFPERSILAD